MSICVMHQAGAITITLLPGKYHLRIEHAGMGKGLRPKPFCSPETTEQPQKGKEAPNQFRNQEVTEYRAASLLKGEEKMFC